MSFNPYLYEKSIAERHSQILHDMQQSHVQAGAGQRAALVRSVASKFGTLLVELGSLLEGVSEHRETPVRSS